MTVVMEMRDVNVGGVTVGMFGFPSDPYFEHIQQASDGNSSWEYALGLMPSGAVIIDIGANIGTTSVLAAAQYDVTVHAMEPSPRARECLEASIAHNTLIGSVIVEGCAIADRTGVANFFEASFLAGSHLTNGEDTHATRSGFSVPLMTLDHYVEKAGLTRIDMIKIDVEGFEQDVLDGAKDTLAKFRPIVIMEFNAWTITAFRNMSPRALLDTIRERFGTAYILREGAVSSIASADDYLAFLHRHLLRHGCVDDLIFCADPSRLATLAATATPVTF